MNFLDRYFKLHEHGSSVSIECMAGLTTYLTMVYVVFVNPLIMSQLGMDYGAVFVATCLAAAFGSLVMGLYANYPIALAPSMGLLVFFAYSVVQGHGYPWQVALGIVFVSGVLFFIMTLLKLREWIINAIPESLKRAMVAGLGLLLAITALKNVGIVIDHPVNLLTTGSWFNVNIWLFLFGFFLIVVLSSRNVPGAILLSMLFTTVVGVALGQVHFTHIISMPPSIKPTLLQLQWPDFTDIGMLVMIFSFVFVALFDSIVTLIGVVYETDLVDEEGRIPRIRQALTSDSLAVMAGGLLGTSTVGSYIESITGVKAGGRTGLTAVVVALLFLLTLFFAPLAETVPHYAASSALIFVGCLMLRSLTDIEWNDYTECLPAALTAVLMPFTFSIAKSISIGFMSYVLLKILAGRYKELNLTLFILALIFAAYLLIV